MKLTYLPDDLVIVQDDPDHPIVASLTMAVTPAGPDVHRLGRLLASAPELLALLTEFLNGERDDYGGLYLNGQEAEAVRDRALDLCLIPYPMTQNPNVQA
ncbi:MAG: hypothetical protein B7Z26_02810 [Asticcacaulis sp. 32-58-5]|nr:MAG: hypothetical protein B7Z26_02810 [Asticcacaulis sp. 32-58-5]